MELTTPQIYAIFAMLTTSALAALVFYSIGLRTGRGAGYELGRESATTHWRKLLDAKRDSNAELREQLDRRGREAMTLRDNIKAEAAEHAKAEHLLLQRLAAAAPLSEEDLAVLLAVAEKLGLAADTFADLSSHDHARFSRHLQAQVLDIAARVKHAQANAQPHPDSELLDWLDENALVHFDPETAELRFPTYHPEESGYDTLRDLLREAIANNETIARNHGELLQAAAQEAAA